MLGAGKSPFAAAIYSSRSGVPTVPQEQRQMAHGTSRMLSFKRPDIGKKSAFTKRFLYRVAWKDK
jgi:hypothetical protein